MFTKDQTGRKRVSSATTLLTLTTALLLLQGCVGGIDRTSTNQSDNQFPSANVIGEPDQTSGGSNTNTVTVSWVAPTQRADGTPLSLSQIDGYEVLYGPRSGDYTESITIDDASKTEAVISELTEGEYYFAVRVYDTSGMRSSPSQERSTTVN